MKYGITLAFLLLLQPTLLQAIELGQIRVQSYLNEPLRASIELREASADDLATARFGLAAPQFFADAGIVQTPVLEQLEFALDLTASPARLLITSAVPVREPFLSFVLAMELQNAISTKSYVMLLDPPMYSVVRSVPAPAASLIAPPAVTPVAEPAPEIAPLSDAQPAASAAQDPLEAAPAVVWQQLGPTRNGDTLWKHAQQAKPSAVSMQQTLVGLHQANPDAFVNGNMHLLKDGQTLAVPPADVLAAIPQAAAIRSIRAHEDAWQAGTARVEDDASLLADALALVMPSAPLVVRIGAQDAAEQTPVAAPVELLSADPAIETTSDTAAPSLAMATESAPVMDELLMLREERNALSQRLDRLEEQLTQSQALLQERDQQLARVEQLLERLDAFGEAAPQTAPTVTEPIEQLPANTEQPVIDQLVRLQPDELIAMNSEENQRTNWDDEQQVISPFWALVAALLALIIIPTGVKFWLKRKIRRASTLADAPSAPHTSDTPTREMQQRRTADASDSEDARRQNHYVELDKALHQVEQQLQPNHNLSRRKVQEAGRALKDTQQVLQSAVSTAGQSVDYVPNDPAEARHAQQDAEAVAAVKRHEDATNLLDFTTDEQQPLTAIDPLAAHATQSFAATIDLAEAFIDIGDLQAARELLQPIREHAQGQQKMTIDLLLSKIDLA